MKSTFFAFLRRFGMGFGITLAIFGGMGALAQVFGGHNSNAPVSYDAGRIEILDKEKRVSLSGNVVITQAGLKVRSDRMLVNYSDNGGIKIARITALDGVVVTRGDEQASGDLAVYDMPRNIITMAGNVRLTRGGDTLNGGRLVIDLNSGVSSVDGGAASGPRSSAEGAGASQGKSGRVTGTFSVKGN